MRESLIHVRAGGGEAGPASGTPAPADDTGASSTDGHREGLLVEVAGVANVSSTEVTERGNATRQNGLAGVE